MSPVCWPASGAALTVALAEGTEARVLATLFEGLLLSISSKARDGVELSVIEGAIALAMALWDAYRP